MPRRSEAAVAETRAQVTRAAVDRASVDGLEGLTIGGLAGEVEMRKSSVFSLFGSKEELQLAALEAAIEQFREEVWGPAADRSPGLERLLVLCESWLSYHQREVMPGGCFLTTATIEYDARRAPSATLSPPRCASGLRRSSGRQPSRSRRASYPADTDPADLRFELNALAAAASYGFQLSRDRTVFDRARRSMRRALGQPG